MTERQTQMCMRTLLALEELVKAAKTLRLSRLYQQARSEEERTAIATAIARSTRRDTSVGYSQK